LTFCSISAKKAQENRFFKALEQVTWNKSKLTNGNIQGELKE
jgi:hypothetical protein